MNEDAEKRYDSLRNIEKGIDEIEKEIDALRQFIDRKYFVLVDVTLHQVEVLRRCLEHCERAPLR